MGIEVFYIAIGGAVGAVFRGVTCMLVDGCWGKKFPIAVFIINICGCFLIGIFTEITHRNGYSENLEKALATGFCGGFSTFSTFVSQTYKLLVGEEFLIAIANVLANHIFGFFACWLGQLIGKSI